MTFNIAHARGLALHQGLRSGTQLRANLLKIAHLIKRLEVDVVALQEIDENSRWSGSFDHLAYLREHSGLPHAVFGITNRMTGRYHLNYGNAMLTRFPIVHSETVSFGTSKVAEKGFLYTELEVSPGLGQRIPVFNLHLHPHSRAQRLRQVTKMMDFIDHQQHSRVSHWITPPLVCGDFNTPSKTPDATATLLGYFERSNNYTLLPKTGMTYPSLWPARSLDYVFLPQECLEPKAKIIRSMLSDHQPVLVEFSLPRPASP